MSEVLVIGFEGPHRSGKGTQIGLLTESLNSQDIPNMMVRGDGSRPAIGGHIGDPVSLWWQNMNLKLRSNESSIADWIDASHRCAKELAYFKERLMPHLLAQTGKQLGVIMCDRSLLSHTMLLREVQQLPFDFYTGQSFAGKPLTPERICPDLIFNFDAPIDVLLDRLDPNDPKYEFRKKNLTANANLFVVAEDQIPPNLQDRVCRINGNQEPIAIHGEVVHTLNKRFARVLLSLREA